MVIFPVPNWSKVCVIPTAVASFGRNFVRIILKDNSLVWCTGEDLLRLILTEGTKSAVIKTGLELFQKLAMMITLQLNIKWCCTLIM